MKISSLPWESAWITGAGRGIGAALARLLSQQGVTVYISARTPADLEKVKQECLDYSGMVVPIPLDITQPAEIEDMMQSWDQGAGIPELVVLNAGTHDPFAATEFSARRCRKLLDINLQGTLNCIDPVLKRYLEKNSGQIAVMTSVAGYRGLPTAAAYGAGKAALINLCEALKLDLKGSQIKLQIISPGFVKTPLTDKNRFTMPAMISAEEAAREIIEGLCKERFEITFPKRFTYILKLLRILPYSIYFRLLGSLVPTVKPEAIEQKHG